MWQQLIVALIVIAAAVYAARVLGPRRWRRRNGASGAQGLVKSAPAGADAQCGCGKDDGGCH